MDWRFTLSAVIILCIVAVGSFALGVLHGRAITQSTIRDTLAVIERRWLSEIAQLAKRSAQSIEPAQRVAKPLREADTGAVERLLTLTRDSLRAALLLISAEAEARDTIDYENDLISTRWAFSARFVPFERLFTFTPSVLDLSIKYLPRDTLRIIAIMNQHMRFGTAAGYDVVHKSYMRVWGKYAINSDVTLEVSAGVSKELFGGFELQYVF